MKQREDKIKDKLFSLERERLAAVANEAKEKNEGSKAENIISDSKVTRYRKPNYGLLNLFYGKDHNIK